jgi:glycosyltransferase involved in cell wall biosynthesis
MEQVSCVMVTDGRLEYFQRSFSCFCLQDYIEKELVIVTCADADYKESIRKIVKQSARQDIRCVFLDSKLPLGALRNISIEHAAGPLICQWDDDDLNHPQRLSMQIRHMQEAGARASFLSDNFHFFADTSQLYWCNWKRSQIHIGHPGTLLAYKNVVPRYNEQLEQREDSFVQLQMRKEGTAIAAISDLGYLYMYIYHGRNVFDRAHHSSLVKAYGFEEATLRERGDEIQSALNKYPYAEPVVVLDHTGREIISWPRNKSFRALTISMTLQQVN